MSTSKYLYTVLLYNTPNSCPCAMHTAHHIESTDPNKWQKVKKFLKQHQFGELIIPDPDEECCTVPYIKAPKGTIVTDAWVDINDQEDVRNLRCWSYNDLLDSF